MMLATAAAGPRISCFHDAIRQQTKSQMFRLCTVAVLSVSMPLLCEDIISPCARHVDIRAVAAAAALPLCCQYCSSDDSVYSFQM